MRQAAMVVLALSFCLPLAAQTPDELWSALLVGNQDFVAGSLEFDELKHHRERLAGHQNPPVTILACADSRVPPELLFDQTLGRIFVIRVAGNVADDFGLASIEYAIARGYTKLVVVLGHASCGAVSAALAEEDPATPSLLQLVQRIRASFSIPTGDPADPDTLRKAIEANARASGAWLPANSRVIRDAIREGKVKIVPAYYDLASGEVKKLE